MSEVCSVALRGTVSSFRAVISLQLHDIGSRRISSLLFGARLQSPSALKHLVIGGNIIVDRARNVKVVLPLLSLRSCSTLLVGPICASYRHDICPLARDFIVRTENY
jgi:hypothetical protein